jgi:hypothetical protein
MKFIYLSSHGPALCLTTLLALTALSSPATAVELFAEVFQNLSQKEMAAGNVDTIVSPMH